jgi:sugar phosphate isomerase/epimerase
LKKIVTDRVLVCAKRHNFDECVSLAKEYGTGVEVQTFAYPNVLDGDWEDLLKQYQKRLRTISGTIAMHGPFLDMASGSPDPLIDQVVRQRVQHALHIAEELNARTVVFHANFIATIRNKEYRTGWTERQITFWAPLAEQVWERAGIVIALENMWEFDPNIIGDVLRNLRLPGLQACLDVGHSYLFSDVGLEAWLSSLDGYITHVHLNNNGGDVDEHRALMDGVLDYETILPSLRRLSNNPAFSLEIERVEDIVRSLPLFDLPR